VARLVTTLPVLLVAAHVLANVVWIGALLSVATLISRARFMADPSELGSLARRVHWQLAVPGFLASVGVGVWRIVLAPETYAHLPWFHVKIGLAFVVVVLHHVIGGRARRLADGQAKAARGIGAVAVLTLLCAAGAVLLGVAKSLR
jgi:putative membrane protein